MKNTLLLFTSVIFFLSSNLVYAKNYSFKCNENFTRLTDGTRYNYKDILFLQIDTDKRIIKEYDDTNRQFWFFKINDISDISYMSEELLYSEEDTEISADTDSSTQAEFNRWTGEYQSQRNSSWHFSKYSCEQISKRLY